MGLSLERTTGPKARDDLRRHQRQGIFRHKARHVARQRQHLDGEKRRVFNRQVALDLVQGFANAALTFGEVELAHVRRIKVPTTAGKRRLHHRRLGALIEAPEIGIETRRRCPPLRQGWPVIEQSLDYHRFFRRHEALEIGRTIDTAHRDFRQIVQRRPHLILS